MAPRPPSTLAWSACRLISDDVLGKADASLADAHTRAGDEPDAVASLLTAEGAFHGFARLARPRSPELWELEVTSDGGAGTVESSCEFWGAGAGGLGGGAIVVVADVDEPERLDLFE